MIRSIRYQFFEIITVRNTCRLEIHIHTVEFYFSGIFVPRGKIDEEIILRHKNSYREEIQDKTRSEIIANRLDSL